jgi:hypothetical protein
MKPLLNGVITESHTRVHRRDEVNGPIDVKGDGSITMCQRPCHKDNPYRNDCCQPILREIRTANGSRSRTRANSQVKWKGDVNESFVVGDARTHRDGDISSEEVNLVLVLDSRWLPYLRFLSRFSIELVWPGNYRLDQRDCDGFERSFD